MAYDYLEAVRDDLALIAKDNADDFIGMYDAAQDGADFESRVIEWLYASHSDITGAESGGYTYSTPDFTWGTEDAKDAVLSNLDLLDDAVDSGLATTDDIGLWLLDQRWEEMDSAIRVDILPQAVHEWTVDGGLRQILDSDTPSAAPTAPTAAADTPGAGI
jgi:hypothetical protein